MKASEFYREPQATVVQSSKLHLAELGARKCYDSYHAIDIEDGVIDNCEEFYLLCADNPEAYRFIDMVRFDKNTYTKDEYNKAKNIMIKHVLKQEPMVIIYNMKLNIDFIRNVAIDKKHESVLEHCNITFHLEFPRNVLQEISRHRIGVSPSVKSTRYTLTELRKRYDEIKKKSLLTSQQSELDDLRKYIESNLGIKDSGLQQITTQNLLNILHRLSEITSDKITNDFLKNILPENWWTEGQYTLSLRAFKHMMDLRLDKSAFLPFRRLAFHMFNALPYEYKELFKNDYEELILNIDEQWKNKEI